MTFGLGTVAALLFLISCGLCVYLINRTEKTIPPIQIHNTSDSLHDLTA
ncbi:hypothetical protein EV586_105250 [Tumebacillus sp. BK434]|nr:hypothetical protein [Tumebacillus sp. BK434]TCP53904.1 hypothetical protein EV586_105250 [Tumebacillus sp. BK434]